MPQGRRLKDSVTGSPGGRPKVEGQIRELVRQFT